MARVPNDKRNLVIGALAVIENDIHSANRKLAEEQDPQGKLNDTYKNGLDSSAKDDIRHAIQVFRWLVEDHFSLSPPAAFTDTDIDNIDQDIRTFEDGN